MSNSDKVNWDEINWEKLAEGLGLSVENTKQFVLEDDYTKERFADFILYNHKKENLDNREGGIDWENDNLEGLTILHAEREYGELETGDLFIYNNIIFENTEDGFINRATTKNYSPTSDNESTILKEIDIVQKILTIVDYDKELIIYDWKNNL